MQRLAAAVGLRRACACLLPPPCCPHPPRCPPLPPTARFPADSKGRTVDFKNTLIILTSNVGSSVIEKGGGGIGFQLDNNEVCGRTGGASGVGCSSCAVGGPGSRATAAGMC